MTAATRPRPTGPIAPGDWTFNRDAAAAMYTNPARRLRLPPLDLLPAPVRAAANQHGIAHDAAVEAQAEADSLARELDTARRDHVTAVDAALRSGSKEPSAAKVDGLADKAAAAASAAVTAWEVRGQRAADVHAAAVAARADHLTAHTALAEQRRQSVAEAFDRARSALAAFQAEADAAAWVDTASTNWAGHGGKRGHSPFNPPRFQVPRQLGARPPRSPIDAIDLAEQYLEHWLTGGQHR